MRGLPRASVAVVLGTRPEIVKLAPVIRRLGDAAFVVHTGQHYDASMSEVFLREHGLADPQLRLGAGGYGRAEQISHMLLGLDRLFAEREFVATVVQGDTNSTLAGALAANARGVALVHVEAGLRSNDRAMPEEHNRVMTDHLADVLCAATAANVENLLAEGIPATRIRLTGNTVVESVLDQLPERAARLRLLVELGLKPDGYVLATIHRPENTDSAVTLRAILTELAALPLPVVLPLHPRTAAAAASGGLAGLLDHLRVVEPMGSSTFLGLAAHAAVLVSDSGGVQEECTVLKRPLVVVRQSTERPEAMADFAVLVEPGPQLGHSVEAMLHGHAHRVSRLQRLPSPFGDRTAADQVVDTIHDLVGGPRQAVAQTANHDR
ncbi:non-hydrolyzing UDP-N-acetylglucosamine 2-epimerase [Nostocoides sp. HKS02]|uniref:non-hydrolyzing UDP-N-acetylglucosamine 2-epimerase n=1 Tax=Nostocoides sp. HKS02 TaxID=1813880 RepID=UPI0012B46096|nr:UDP-N-acetylglucosamine 2-epimerase (non-hydrolyzing) [Tetrasphaera sp. HKS02]QGN58688.1 UDP-N-acetylglucosamine 2-epimerase (non-hydrolyzing) [Tetrasphaera sp. HKS02]